MLDGEYNLEEDIENQFKKLISEWADDTKHLSSIGQMLKHPAFEQLKAMGGQYVLPLIFRELQDGRARWPYFALIREFAEVPEVPVGIRGKYQKVVNHFLRWGKEHGYVA